MKKLVKLKKLETLITNPILVGIVMLKDLIDIVKSLFSSGSFNVGTIMINWWDFSMKLIIVIFLWLILRAYLRLKGNFEEQMTVFSIISHIRNKRLFVKSFEDIEYFRVPNESDKEFWERLPEGGLFKQHYFEEYMLVRDELQNRKMKNKGLEEIDDILAKWYPFAKGKEH